MNDMDLKKMLNLMGELEPPSRLKVRILSEIRSHESWNEFWFLKPAVALASVLLLALLGAKVTTHFVPEKSAYKESSAVLQWAKQVESPAPKISKDKGGFFS